uniref:Chlorophyll a-b binding protein, chloroplastic n=1 Tax=Ulva prolifera TaxID=3117 RepID=E7E8I6_ULVPR|nr:LhcSR [Ulva prolifera]
MGRFTRSTVLSFNQQQHTATMMAMSALCHSRVAARPANNRMVAARATPGEDYAKTLNGITGPFGFFDPLSMSAQTTPEEVKRYREAELTHGRVSMLAALGFLAGEAVENIPLFMNWEGNISGPAIVHFQQTKQGFWEPLVLVIGICEAYRVSVGWANPVEKGTFTLRDEYAPGDLGFDPLGLKPTSAEEFNTLQTKELNNGRLAMIAVAGFVAQELVNKQGIIENLKASS